MQTWRGWGSANMSNNIRFLTFEQVHNKRNAGSTKIRVHNLIKNWQEADLYQYGEKPDVLVFQKVYITKDYDFPKTLDSIKILDVCDPDWLEGSMVKQTVDAMDAVVVPTKPLQEFIQQLTDKPVVVIKDRFDLTEFPQKKIHRGRAKEVVWFGYSHNATCLRLAVQSIERRGLKLKVVAEQDPFADRWARDPDKYHELYSFVKYTHETAYEEIQKADICVLPKENRPQDRFKSENKTVIAKLLGLPVATTAEEIDNLMDAKNRTINDKDYAKLQNEYDCKLSVKEYKELIDEIKTQV